MAKKANSDRSDDSGFNDLSTDYINDTLRELEFQTALLDAVEQAIIATDVEGNIFYWNRFAEELYGWKANEVMGKNIVEVTVPDLSVRQAEKIMEILGKGQRWTGEFQVKNKNGETFYAHVTDSPMFNKNGSLIGIIGVSYDITAQKESENKYRILVEDSPNMIGIFQDNRYIYANKTLLKKTGWELEEITSTDFNFLENIFPKKHHDTIKENIRKRKSGKEVPPYEITVFKKNRELMDVIIYGNSIDIGGKPAIQYMLVDVTEERIAEKELRKSEEKFRQLAENVTGIFYVYDIESEKFEYVSPKYEEVWQRSLEEIYDDQLSFTYDIHPDDRDKFQEAVKKELEEQQYLNLEYRIIRKDGSEVWLWSRNFPVTDEKGEVYRIVGIAEDITERKIAEEQLNESKEELQNILEATTDGIWKWDFRSDEMLFSPKYYTMLGYEVDEFQATYENWEKLIHPDDRENALKIAGEFLKTKPDLYENEFRLRTKSGDYKWIHSRARIVERDDKGNAILMIGNHEDITDRKMVEQELRNSEKRLEIIFEYSPIAIALVNEKGVPILTNKAFSKMMNYTVEELENLSFEKFTHPDDLIKEQKLLQAVLEGKKDSYSLQKRNFTKEGKTIWLDAQITVIRGQNGDLEYLLATGTNITAERLALEKLKASERALTEAQGTAKIGSWEYDAVTDRRSWSKEMFRIFGVDQDSCEPSWDEQLQIIHPDDREKIDIAFKKANTDGSPYKEEFRIMHRDKEIKWAETNGKVHKDESGDIVKLSGTVQDITDRKNSEIELKANERLLSTIADNYPNSYLSIIEKNMTISFSAGQEFKNQNIDPEQYNGMSLDEVFGDQASFIKKEYRKTLKGVERSFELFFNEQNQLYRTVPLYEEDGEIRRILSVVENITDRKKAEKELQSRNEVFMKIFQSNPAATAFTRLDNNEFVKVNSVWLEKTGYSEKEVIGKTPIELNLWVDPGQRDDIVRSMIEKGRAQSEVRVRSKKGDFFDVLLSAEIVEFEGNKYLLSMAQDITERKIYEEELKESERNLKLAQKIAKIGNWSWDIKTGRFTWSDEVYRIFGAPNKLPDYEFTRSFVHQDDLDIWQKIIQKAVEDQKPFSLDYRAVRTDDETIWVHIESETIFDEDGGLSGYSGTVQDITAYKIVEEALKHQSEFIETIINTATVSTWISDEKGTLIRANPACLEFFGAAEEEVVGKYNIFKDNVAKEKGFLPEIKRVFEKGETVDFTIDYDFATVDHVDVNEATHKIIHTYLTPILDENKKVTNVIVQAIDLTERVKHEQELKEREERFKKLFENSPDLLAIINKEGVFLDINREVWGLKKDQIIGRTIPSFIPDKYNKNFKDAVNKSVKTGKYQNYEVEVKSPSGKMTYWYNRVSYLESQNGEDQFLVNFTDITDRKKLELEQIRIAREWQTTFDASNDVIWILDKKQNIIRSNKTVERVLEVPVDNLLGKHCWEVIHGADKPIKGCPLRMSKKSLERETMELNIGDRWFQVIVDPILDENEKYNGAVHIIRDITEKKLSERALVQSERILNSTGKMGMIGGWEHDLLSGKAVWTEALYDIIEIPYDKEPPGVEEHLDYYPPEERKKLEKEYGKCVEKGVSFDLELNVYTANKKLIWCRAQGEPVFENGKCVKIIGTFQDITERKKAQESLLYEKNRAQQYLEVSGVMLISLDRNQKVTVINTKGCEILGAPREDILGKNWFDTFLPEENLIEVKEVFDQIISGDIEPVKYFENPIVRKDGEIRIIAWHNSVLHNESGEIIGLFSSGEDITERKMAEKTKNVIYEISKAAGSGISLDELYSKIHELLGELIDVRNFYIAIYDEKTDLLTYQYFVDEVDKEMYEPQNVKISKSSSAYVIKKGKTFFRDRATLRNLQRSGKIEIVGSESKIWIGVPLIARDRKIGVMVVQDYHDPVHYTEEDVKLLEFVSEQIAAAIESKKTEESLQKTKERFRLAAESVSDLIYEWNVESGDIRWFGDIDSVLGYKKGKLKRTLEAWLQRIHPDDLTRINASIEMHKIRPEPINLNYRIIHQNKSWLHWNEKGTCITGENGNPVKYIGVCTDITKQTLMEQMLMQSEKMAAIGTLAAGVAHEINNPMGYIDSNLRILNKYSELIKKYDSEISMLFDNIDLTVMDNISVLKEEVENLRRNLNFDFILEDCLSAIGESIEGTERVKKIVSDLRDFSREEKFEIKPSDINAGLEKTLNVIWNEIKYKVKVVKDLGDIPVIECDLQRLNQVFLNLVINGAQAIEDRGKIFIKTRKEGDRVRIEIGDTGKGIPREELSRIFDAFFTTKAPGKGTGLGLSIAYKIIQDHNGSIEVDSQPGFGTKFIIRLPVKQEA